MKGSRLRIGLSLALLALAVAVFVLPATALAAEPPGLQRAMQVQERNTARLMALPGVVGTAVGLDAQGQPVVKVFTAQAGVAGVPANLDGLSVAVDVTGPFIALPGGAPGKKPPPEPGVDPTARFDDPVPIGVSVGNAFDCSAGTLGCTVVDASGVFYMLSNHHVLDPYHIFQDPDQAGQVHPVVQPARLDDPNDTCSGLADPNNILGKLVDSSLIDFQGGDNDIDAAIAVVPTDLYQQYGGEGDCRTLGASTPVDGYGTPKAETQAASLGLAVQKYGRSTSLTKGEVTDLNGIVDVKYDSGTARFVGQIIVSGRRFIKPGDSGSLLVTDPNANPVGLLFAGSGSGKMAIANPLDPVLDRFNVTIVGD